MDEEFIDVCAINDPCCKPIAVESGLPLGALGPLAAQQSIEQILRQLVDAQREQTELLRKHVLPLWTRIRFSLLALLLLMTVVAIGSGFTVWAVRSANTPPPAPATTVRIVPTQPAPSITARAAEWLIRADSSRSP